MVNSNHIQTIGAKYEVKIISENEFKIKIKREKIKQFDIARDQFIENYQTNVKYENKHNFNELIETENFKFKIIKSKFFNEKYINDNFYFIINNMENLTKRTQKRLEIHPINKDASLVKLTYKDAVPKKIIDFLNQHSIEYIETGLNQKNQIANNTIKFITNLINEITDSLQTAEYSLENFKSENPKIELNKKDYGDLYQIQKLDSEKAILDVNIKYFTEMLNYIQENNKINNLIAPSAMGITDPLLNKIINDITSLYSERRILLLNTTNKHPIIQNINKEIENKRKILIENLKNLIQNTRISLEDIKSRIFKLDDKLTELPRTERMLLGIERKFNINESLYIYLLEKRAETAIARAGNVSDHDIIDKARLIKNSPLTPNKNIIYMIFIAVSLLIPTLFIILKDFFNENILNLKQLQELTNMPILGAIRHSDQNTSLVVINKPKSAISEAFRGIRTNLEYMTSDKKNKLICITSSISREGKTFCSINISSVLALSEKTLLIGSDLRRPRIFSEIQISNDKGLSNYLIGKNSLEDIIQKNIFKNLDIISSRQKNKVVYFNCVWIVANRLSSFVRIYINFFHTQIYMYICFFISI